MPSVILHPLIDPGVSSSVRSRGKTVQEIQEQGRQGYAALLYGLHRAQRSGILELHHGRTWRKVFLVLGTPVLYESSIDGERLSKTLVQAGLVEQKPLSKILSKLQPGEQLEDKLVAAGLVGPEELHAHKRSFLERSAASALAWTSFKWRFLSNDAVGSAIDPALIPHVNPLRGLWGAVKQNVTMDEALPFVDNKDAGKLLSTEDLATVVEAMELEAPLDRLPEVLADEGMSLEDLFGTINDKSGHLVPLVWFLETIGALGRENRPTLGEPLASLTAGTSLAGEEPLVPESKPKAQAERPKKPSPSSKKAPSAKAGKKAGPKKGGAKTTDTGSHSVSHLPELLATTRRHRAGKDFYAFLDLDSDADQATIEEAFGRYTKLWKSAAETEGLPEEGRRDATALLEAARQVFETLSSEEARAAYDAKMASGNPGALAALPVQDAAGGAAAAGEADEKLEAARKLIARGEVDVAVGLLQQLRLTLPSSPGVLAELGWATWKQKGDQDDSAEEFLQLALTFDPQYLPALENLGRVAADKGDADQLAALIQRVKKLDAENSWAQEASQLIEDMTSKGGKQKKRFWRRGG